MFRGYQTIRKVLCISIIKDRLTTVSTRWFPQRVSLIVKPGSGMTKCRIATFMYLQPSDPKKSSSSRGTGTSKLSAYQMLASSEAQIEATISKCPMKLPDSTMPRRLDRWALSKVWKKSVQKWKCWANRPTSQPSRVSIKILWQMHRQEVCPQISYFFLFKAWETVEKSVLSPCHAPHCRKLVQKAAKTQSNASVRVNREWNRSSGTGTNWSRHSNPLTLCPSSRKSTKKLSGTIRNWSSPKIKDSR